MKTADKKNTRFQTGNVVTLGFAHFIHDVYTAFLSPILPLLIEKLKMNLAMAGSLSFFVSLPSLFNPVVGAALDRGGLSKWLVIVSPALSAIGMCLVGMAPNYILLMLLLLTCGISVAAIHVAAPPMVSQISGKRTGRGMGVFMLGGELARTAGPLIAVWAVSVFTLEGLWKMAPIGIVASGILWWRVRRIEITPREKPPTGLIAVWKEMRFTIFAVMGIMTARGFMAAAMTSFLPTFEYSNGTGLLWANLALFAFQFGGAAGALASGTISDWLGRKKVLIALVTAAPPLMLVFLNFEGPVRWISLVLMGFVTISTTPVLMTLMMESSGENPAAANGTFLMMSFALRAVIVIFVGLIADVVGLRTTYYICAAVATLGIPFVLMLPKQVVKKTG